MDSILDPLGLPFGSLLAPKMAETCLGIPLGAAKSCSRLLFLAPRAPQEASKSAPSAPGSPPFADQAFLRAPRHLQEAPKRPPRPIWQPCWHHFGAISKRCCHCVGHVSSLKAPSPRAVHPRSQAMFVGVPWPRALNPTPQARRNARERLNPPPPTGEPSVLDQVLESSCTYRRLTSVNLQARWFTI